MNNSPQPPDSPREWEHGWDEHQRRQLQRVAKLSLPEKLVWLEEAHRLVPQLSKNAEPQAAKRS